MKRITIIGDSNGSGEWMLNPLNNNEPQTEDFFFRNPIFGHKHRLIETHPGLEFYLTEYGHTCYNMSLGGNSNLQMLIDLQYSLSLRQPRHRARFMFPDYIIWILTEPLRDMNTVNIQEFLSNSPTYCEKVLSLMKNINDIKELNLAILDFSFEIAESIYQHTKIPWIIVEGLSLTYDLEKKYNFCQAKIENWIGNAAGIVPPITATNQVFYLSQDYLEKRFKFEQVEKLLNEYSTWVGILHNHIDFPDRIHPSREKHRELAIKINEIINK